MKIKIEPAAELKFVRKSLKVSIICIKNENGKRAYLSDIEEKKDLKALKRVLRYYGG